MSGIIGHSGSKSGRIGLVSNEWKLIETRDLTNESGNNGVINFTTASSLKPGRYLKYRFHCAGLRCSGSQAEFRIRWSCVSGATTGTSHSNYYGARWSKHNNSGAGIGNDTTNGHDRLRVCYMNDPTGDGVQQVIIETDNVGVSDVAGNADKYVFYCWSLGYVSFTSSAGYGPSISAGNNTHNDNKASASGGELTAITLSNDQGAWTHGTMRLYGLVK